MKKIIVLGVIFFLLISLISCDKEKTNSDYISIAKIAREYVESEQPLASREYFYLRTLENEDGDMFLVEFADLPNADILNVSMVYIKKDTMEVMGIEPDGGFFSGITSGMAAVTRTSTESQETEYTMFNLVDKNNNLDFLLDYDYPYSEPLQIEENNQQQGVVLSEKDIYNLYYEKYLELVLLYGIGSLVSKDYMGYGNNSYLDGVCVVELMDFNGDGLKDLFLVYSNGELTGASSNIWKTDEPQYKFPLANNYTIEI